MCSKSGTLQCYGTSELYQVHCNGFVDCRDMRPSTAKSFPSLLSWNSWHCCRLGDHHPQIFFLHALIFCYTSNELLHQILTNKKQETNEKHTRYTLCSASYSSTIFCTKFSIVCQKQKTVMENWSYIHRQRSRKQFILKTSVKSEVNHKHIWVNTVNYILPSG